MPELSEFVDFFPFPNSESSLRSKTSVGKFKERTEKQVEMKNAVVLHLLFSSFIFNGSIVVNLFVRCCLILKVGPIS